MGIVVHGPATSDRCPRASHGLLRMDLELYEGYGDVHCPPGATEKRPCTQPRVALQQIYSSGELADVLRQRREGRGSDGDGKMKVVLFGSRSCPLCRRMAGRVRQVAPQAPGARFYYVEHSAAANEAFALHEIHTLPCLCIFDSGGEFQESFLCTPDALKSFLGARGDVLDLRRRRLWGA